MKSLAAVRWPKLRAGVFAVIAALTAAVVAEEAWRALSHRDEKLTLVGVANFGRMNTHLYRGAQPTPEGFTHLRDLGITTVVRLSLGEEAGAAEEAIVGDLGMRFLALPWNATDVPRDAQVSSFFEYVTAHPDEKVFLHCKAGVDRTGVFVAAYRIAIDHWSAADAIDEMKAFHYRYVFQPQLQRYVEALPARLGRDRRLGSIDSQVDQRR